MNEQEILDRAKRAAMSVDEIDQPYDALLRRRNRKRRNQRITAGVVGIAVFVAAVWIVTSGLSFDRTQTPAVPATSGTTGPAETGPAETGPAVSPPYDYDPTADFVGLPPEGAQPSSPATSDLVAEGHETHVGWVYVFEDGRVISKSSGPMPEGFIEQRLTPKGVELVRSGVIQTSDFICFEKLPNRFGNGCQGPLHEIPPSAWEDSTLRPYVPYRYAICTAGPLGTLPVAAQDLLRGKLETFEVAWTRQGAGCFDVTTEQARALDQILAYAGFRAGFSRVADGGHQRWSDPLDEPWASFEPILPHGTFGSQGGG